MYKINLWYPRGCAYTIITIQVNVTCQNIIKSYISTRTLRYHIPKYYTNIKNNVHFQLENKNLQWCSYKLYLKKNNIYQLIIS